VPLARQRDEIGQKSDCQTRPRLIELCKIEEKTPPAQFPDRVAIQGVCSANEKNITAVSANLLARTEVPASGNLGTLFTTIPGITI
jgi:hypothetical protein